MSRRNNTQNFRVNVGVTVRGHVCAQHVVTNINCCHFTRLHRPHSRLVVR